MANVVSVVDAAGSPVPIVMQFGLRNGLLHLEVELLFGMQNKFGSLQWLDQYCPRHPEAFVVI